MARQNGKWTEGVPSELGHQLIHSKGKKIFFFPALNIGKWIARLLAQSYRHEHYINETINKREFGAIYLRGYKNVSLTISSSRIR